MKIAVMTDSTANLPKHIIEKYQIPVAPLSVTFDDGETFTEHPDLSKESFYKKWPHLKQFLQQVNQLLVNG